MQQTLILKQHIYTPNNGFKNGPKSSKPRPLLHKLSLTPKKIKIKNKKAYLKCKNSKSCYNTNRIEQKNKLYIAQ